MLDLGKRLAEMALLPVHYERDQQWQTAGAGSAAQRRTLLSPNVMAVNIGGSGFAITRQIALDLNEPSSWDAQSPVDYTQVPNRAGKDFFVYMCHLQSGGGAALVISANSTYPSGYSPSTSRKVAGFHCLCMGTGTEERRRRT